MFFLNKFFKLRILLIKVLRRFESKGEKRLFLVFGMLNFLITNFTLQVLLLLTQTIFATIFSQLVNLIIGYYLYGKKVFKHNRLNKLVFKKYLFLSLILWLSNFVLIESLFNYGINKNLAAIFIIPLLVLISFLSQKYFVFR
tara:strand:- start:840 stop:1265 length:426 start_codon:yes stop_codon:yes gene_type:complete